MNDYTLVNDDSDTELDTVPAGDDVAENDSELEPKEDLRADIRADIESAIAEVEKQQPIETDKTAKASAEVAAKVEPQAKEGHSSPASDSQPLAPPSGWAADKKEHWAKLPRDVQEYLNSRESEVQRFVQQKSQEAAKSTRERDAFFQALAPRAEILQRIGVHPVEYIQNLVRAEQMMDQDPASAIARLASHYGLDLAQVAASVQQQSPEVAQVRQELNAMRMEQVQREQQARMQAHEQYRASAANVIEDFRQATDEKGVALFPHASDPSFQQAMALELRALTQSEPQTPLEDRLIKAYDATVWKLPHTRQAELEKEMRIKQARAASEAKAKAEAARRREVSVSGAPGASALKVQSNGSVRDDILAAMEQLGVS